jgi:hypothetical protein
MVSSLCLSTISASQSSRADARWPVWRHRPAVELDRGGYRAPRERPTCRALDGIQDEVKKEASHSDLPMFGDKFSA